MIKVFAEVGSSLQQVGGNCPDGWIVMHGERPSPEHVAQADGSWVLPDPAVPRSITMRQARLLLHSRGLLASVQEAIDSLDEPPRIAAQIEWDYSSTMERDKPFVAMIAGHIGLTNDDLDEMFIEAAAL